MSVAEFMQKPVKKYACGSKAQKAKKTLVKAFTASKDGDAIKEGMLFEDIVDSVMKTEKGRETMTTLAGLGYSFAFETGNFCGFCNSDNKKIVINPNFPFSYMLQTAVHEGTHAIQNSLEPNAPDDSMMQVASLLRSSRAVEADACAHQMAFVYECKDVLPAVYQDAKEQNLPMFRAFVGEMEKSGDEKKAMQASFAAWYECEEYRDSYDKYYKECIVEICEYGKEHQQEAVFSREYPAEDVLKMCRYNGKPYMTPDFLNKGLAFSITAEDKKAINAALRNYAKVVGKEPDTSLSAMRERTADGTLLPEKEAVNAAVVAKAGRGGR